MDEHDWLQRIDRHLEASEDHMRRGNEIMAQSNEIMARNERAFLDLQSYLREATAMLGRMAAGIHDQTVAFVASQRELREEIREQRAEMREQRVEMREHGKETREHHDEVREEMRAGRAALFAMIDRLNEGPRPSGA
jgi:Rad3-related DNA helicase